MKIGFTNNRINRALTRLTLIIASTAIIVWFLPHNESQRIRWQAMDVRLFHRQV